jgi:hypothetical protein
MEMFICNSQSFPQGLDPLDQIAREFATASSFTEAKLDLELKYRDQPSITPNYLLREKECKSDRRN